VESVGSRVKLHFDFAQVREVTMKITKKAFVAIFTAFLVVTFQVYAQESESAGRIEGVVRDPSGAVVPHVQVVAKNVATGVEQSTLTDAAGSYSFPVAVTGEYTVSASVAGFKTAVRTGVRVISGLAQTVDFGLAVGQITQRVEVTARAAAVDTLSSAVGTTKVNEELSTLPVFMSGGGPGGARASQFLMLTLPGVNYDSSQTYGVNVAQTANVNGAATGMQGGNFNFEIDGLRASYTGTAADNAGGPVPEAVSELRLSTSPNADEGWNSGVTLSLVMKSGTNTLHGSLFDYLRNSALDSRNWLASSVSVSRMNNFGFSIGGPVVLPKLYNGRDRTFFFGTYDGYRFRSAPGGVSSTVPTAKMRTGDFSEWLGPQIGTDVLGRPIYQNEIYDPATTRSDSQGGFIRDPFMYNGQLNVIDPARLSSISQSFQKGFFTATQPGLSSNWIGVAPNMPTNQDRMTIKIDHAFSEKQHLSFGYDNTWLYWLSVTGTHAPSIDFGYTDLVTQPRVRFNYTWTMRPNLLFGANLSYMRWQQILPAYGAALTYGRASGWTGGLTPGTPSVGIQDLGGFGNIWNVLNAWFGNWPANVYLAWTKSRHNLKFGAEYYLTGDTQVTAIFSDGNISFERLETGLPTYPTTGVGYASFLLGEVDSGSVTSPTATKQTTPSYALYAQDQWRVTDKLTLNYGLRWDLFAPQHESYNRYGSFDPTVSNPGAGGRLGALTIWGNGPGRNGRTGLWDFYPKALGPRFGFAYAFNSKTVVRGNYGVTYMPYFRVFQFANVPWYGSQFTLSSSSVDEGVTPAFNWQNGFPVPVPALPFTNPALLNGSGVQWINPKDNKPGMSQNISFGVTREFPGALVLKAEYVGNMTHSYPVNIDYDYLPQSDLSLNSLLLANINSPQAQAAGIASPYPGFNGSVQQALLPYPQYTGVSEIYAPAGSVTYNSGQFSLQKRVGQGLTLLAAYTVSKQIQSGANWPYGSLRRLGKSLDGADRPQILALSYTYELPVGPGKRFGNTSNPVFKQAIGGWQVSGIHSYMAGYPVTLANWVNLVPGTPIKTAAGCGNYDPNNPTRNQYLNVNAFAVPATFTFGNTYVLPNTRSCGFLNENLSIAKVFFVKERIRPRFGVDFFNAFNRHQWLGLNSDITSPGFGEYTSASQPREIQAYLRIEF